MVLSALSGEQIRREREAAGLSQQELAEKMNTSMSAVSKWERDIAKMSPRNRETFRKIVSHPESEALDAESMRNRILIRHRNIALEGLEILCELALDGSKTAEEQLRKIGKEISEVLGRLPTPDGK